MRQSMIAPAAPATTKAIVGLACDPVCGHLQKIFALDKQYKESSTNDPGVDGDMCTPTMYGWIPHGSGACSMRPILANPPVSWETAAVRGLHGKRIGDPPPAFPLLPAGPGRIVRVVSNGSWTGKGQQGDHRGGLWTRKGGCPTRHDYISFVEKSKWTRKGESRPWPAGRPQKKDTVGPTPPTPSARTGRPGTPTTTLRRTSGFCGGGEGGCVGGEGEGGLCWDHRSARFALRAIICIVDRLLRMLIWSDF